MTRRLAPLAALVLLVVAACDAAGFLGAPTTPGASGSPSPMPSATGSPGPSASPGASAAPAASPTADPRLPAEDPYIEGEVISSEPAGGGQLHSGRIQVVATTGGNQAVVTLLAATSVWRRGTGGALTRGSLADLRVGQTVRVWAGGPVRESFPVQLDAKAVLILSSP